MKFPCKIRFPIKNVKMLLSHKTDNTVKLEGRTLESPWAKKAWKKGI